VTVLDCAGRTITEIPDEVRDSAHANAVEDSPPIAPHPKPVEATMATRKINGLGTKYLPNLIKRIPLWVCLGISN
jgi:hypothetical protein